MKTVFKRFIQTIVIIHFQMRLQFLWKL